MNVLLIILVIILWIGLGMWGYIYWWTRDFGLDALNLVFSILVGISQGIFSWIIGYAIHGSRKNVIKKRRK